MSIYFVILCKAKNKVILPIIALILLLVALNVKYQ